MILVARYHIYICKMKETRPSLEIYEQLVYNTLQIESKIAIANNSLHVFKKNWSCFKNIAPFQSINQSTKYKLSGARRGRTPVPVFAFVLLLLFFLLHTYNYKRPFLLPLVSLESIVKLYSRAIK